MPNEDRRPSTIFCDIDGTLVEHSKPVDCQLPSHKLKVLKGSLEKLSEWESMGYNIILTTGRKESLRSVTEKQLESAGIIYDQLIMGIGGGKRYLINDKKPNGDITAFSFSPQRNKGINELEL